ncbi:MULTISPECIES: magnesium chelatase domain-containing protein [Mesobacillus]|uniref:Magnesium chelatase family protein n=1 Tax=Mesobacillus stamsii TaxID=225347 RepID=A0ABU0G081_9BACI|nr:MULTISPECIES: magnesium chelatase domain-containing protein [Mesobacillus]MDQ0415596.1 magnesium chelatase family protein [Mesobacillus stamsii]
MKRLEAYRVDVEVQVKEGFESIVIVGLPDASVKESKERVAAALHTIGFTLVEKKVIINLSSAEQKKNGPLFDLAIAIGILKSDGFIADRIPDDAGFIGAMSLDGTVHPVEGMIATVLAAKKLRMKQLVLPFDPTIPRMEIVDLELETLLDVNKFLAGQLMCFPSPPWRPIF